MSHVGDDIRRARELKKLSIDDLARMTKISASIIDDIENGRFDSYEGDEPYVRMYIKKISMILGLDGYELTQQYDHLSNEIKKEMEENKANTPQNSTIAKKVDFSKKDFVRSPSVYEDRSHITLIRGGIILVLICLVVGIVWYAIVSTSKDPSQFKDPNQTIVEGDVPVKNETDTEKPKEEPASAVIEKVADFDYQFKVTGNKDTFVIRMEFMNQTWNNIFMDYVNGVKLDGFESRIYGPKDKATIEANAEKIKKQNEEFPHIKIEQKEDMEVVELTMTTQEFNELYLRTGYSNGHRYYINGVEIMLSDQEKIEGVANLHLSIVKEQ